MPSRFGAVVLHAVAVSLLGKKYVHIPHHTTIPLRGSCCVRSRRGETNAPRGRVGLGLPCGVSMWPHVTLWVCGRGERLGVRMAYYLWLCVHGAGGVACARTILLAIPWPRTDRAGAGVACSVWICYHAAAGLVCFRTATCGCMATVRYVGVRVTYELWTWDHVATGQVRV